MSYLGFDFHKAQELFIRKHGGDVSKGDEEFLKFLNKIRADEKKARLLVAASKRKEKIDDFQNKFY